MHQLQIPAEWDDDHLHMFEEFCELIGAPEGVVHECRFRGVGPTWTKFQGVGRLYITAEEARRFVRTAIVGEPLGGCDD